MASQKPGPKAGVYANNRAQFAAAQHLLHTSRALTMFWAHVMRLHGHSVEFFQDEVVVTLASDMSDGSQA